MCGAKGCPAGLGFEILRILVNNNWPPPPLVFVSVASKGFRISVSGLESTLAGCLISVDSTRLR